MTDTEQATFGGLNIVGDVKHSNRDVVVEHISGVCDDKLPRQAKTGDWPVRFDHCFRRLAYDAACEGKWRDHVDGDTFIDDADKDQLRKALRHAVRMMYEGEEYAWKLQEYSLIWRGEMSIDEADYVEEGDL